jgi:hypothetical protein
MDWWEIVLLIIGLLTVLIIYIYSQLRKGKELEKVQVLPNAPIVENRCRRQFTDGYGEGILVEERLNYNGTTRIKFLPIDIKQGEGVKYPGVQTVVVANRYLKRVPEGEDGKRARIILFGRSILDYPEYMRDSVEGKFMEEEGQKAWLLSMVGKSIANGDKVIGEWMSEYARGNVSKHSIEHQKEIERALKSQEQKKED